MGGVYVRKLRSTILVAEGAQQVALLAPLLGALYIDFVWVSKGHAYAGRGGGGTHWKGGDPEP